MVRTVLVAVFVLGCGAPDAPPEPTSELPAPPNHAGCGEPTQLRVPHGETREALDLRVTSRGIGHDQLDEGFDLYVTLELEHDGRVEQRMPSLLGLPQPAPERVLGRCVRVIRGDDDAVELDIAPLTEP